jgi:hypothetical protein
MSCTRHRVTSLFTCCPQFIMRADRDICFGMNQSLDGIFEHAALPAPSPTPFQFSVDEARSRIGSLYGRRMYELMRYRDEGRAEWGAAERERA